MVTSFMIWSRDKVMEAMGSVSNSQRKIIVVE